MRKIFASDFIFIINVINTIYTMFFYIKLIKYLH